MIKLVIRMISGEVYFDWWNANEKIFIGYGLCAERRRWLKFDEAFADVGAVTGPVYVREFLLRWGAEIGGYFA